MLDYAQPLMYGVATGILSVLAPRFLALPIQLFRRIAERA